MTRLNIVAEGQTEEAFINNVIRHHLAPFEVYAYVRCVETGRDRKRNRIFRGGLLDYEKLKKDLTLWMKQDQKQDAWFTTMIDLYALPDNFPGFAAAALMNDPYKKIDILENELLKDIGHPRFIPYIQLHEFEALILVEPSEMSTFFIEQTSAISDLEKLSSTFESPELINQGRDTAPSKRIIEKIPEYRGLKSTVGSAVAEKIGLVKIRKKCPHFDSWLAKLEQLSTK